MRDDLRESAHTDEGSLDAAVRQAWKAAGQGEAEGLWERFEARYMGEEANNGHAAPLRHNRENKRAASLPNKNVQWGRRFVFGVAASLLLIVGWFTGAERVSSKIASNVSVYTTNNGDRATITLPDGSTVLLNVGSRLEVPGNFATGTRSLKLTGEGLFNVKHQSGAPFTVVSGSTVTRVLGTTFVVRKYDTDVGTMVAVKDGKVQVESEILTESERVFIDGAGAVTKAIATDAQFSFAANVLKIEGVQLAEAIHDLNRWYDVDIRLSSNSEELGKRVVQGDFAVGTRNDIASIISFMFNVRVERQGRILTIHSR